MHELAKYLNEHETITGEEFMDILNRKAEEVPEEDASASLTNRS
jgi:cell division protease FtsH